MSTNRYEWDINTAIASAEDAVAKVRMLNPMDDGPGVAGEEFLRHLRKVRVEAWRAMRQGDATAPSLPPNYDDGTEAKKYFETHRVSIQKK